MHLNAINQLDWAKALDARLFVRARAAGRGAARLAGKHDNVQTGQRVFAHRAKCVSAAALGTYTTAMEGELARHEPSRS